LRKRVELRYGVASYGKKMTACESFAQSQTHAPYGDPPTAIGATVRINGQFA